MTNLSGLEQQVLEELGDDSTSPDIYDVDPDMREAICDAIDEACINSPFYEKEFFIKLSANVAFYSISPQWGYPLYVRSARISGSDVPLVPSTLGRLVRESPQFLIDRGTPRTFVSISPSIILFHPCNSVAEDTIRISLVYTPKPYVDGRQVLTIREEFENALIHYAKYHKLLQTKGSFDEAIFEYSEYLKTLGMMGAIKDHARQLAKVRFSQKYGRQYGEEVRR